MNGADYGLKREVLEWLSKREPNFRWDSFFNEGVSVSKDDLIKAVEEGSSVGELFLKLVSEHGQDPDRAVGYDSRNKQGKRFCCEICETEVLCTKPGLGRIACCGRPMESILPKPLPSSD